MKPELHQLKLHLHLAKPGLHPHNIIKLFINCVDEARALPAEDPPSSGEACASSDNIIIIFDKYNVCEAELGNVKGSAATKSAVQ